MTTLLTQNELKNTLMDFRFILCHFDYSSIGNITFLNPEAFYSYMENVADNPFQKQYNALQEKLNILEPYLPFINSERAADFLKALAKADTKEETQTIKKKYTAILRNDFIHFARTVTCSEEWEKVIEACEEIRLHKEEMQLALD